MKAYSPHLDILLATWEGGGNVPPVLGAACRLIAHGHRVRIMADAVVGPAATRAAPNFAPGSVHQAAATTRPPPTCCATGKPAVTSAAS